MRPPAVACFEAQKQRDARVSRRDTCSVAQHLDKWGTAMRRNELRHDLGNDDPCPPRQSINFLVYGKGKQNA